MSQAIEEQIKELLIERLFLDFEPSDRENSTALSEYGIDPFLMLELVVALEEQFSVQFDPSDITAEAIKSIDSLVALVRSKEA